MPDDLDLTKASLACGAMQLLTVKAVADVWLLSDQWGAAATRSPDALALLAEPPAVFGAVVWTGLVTTFGTVLVETLALSEISAQESTVLIQHGRSGAPASRRSRSASASTNTRRRAAS